LHQSTSVYLDKATVARLDNLARHYGTSRSGVVRIIAANEALRVAPLVAHERHRTGTTNAAGREGNSR
jgi:predicted transcriptional regulator